MNRHALSLLIAAAWSAAMGSAHALSFGEVSIQSSAGEPLRAEVEIIEKFSGEADGDLDLNITGAGGEKTGARSANALIQKLKFSAYRRRDARLYLRVQSDEPITSPQFALTFMAQAGGKSARKTVQFDLKAKRQDAIAGQGEVVDLTQDEGADTNATREGASPNPNVARPGWDNYSMDNKVADGTQAASNDDDVGFVRDSGNAPQAPVRDAQLPPPDVGGGYKPNPARDAVSPRIIASDANPSASVEAGLADLQLGDLFVQGDGPIRAGPVAMGSLAETLGTDRGTIRQMFEDKTEARGAQELRVGKGQSLKTLARKAKYPNVSLDQMMVALYQANPDAFNGDNLLRIKRGSTLQVPDEATVLAVDQDEAAQTVRAHSKDFASYRATMAGKPAAVSAEKTDKQGLSGKIKSQVQEEKKANSPDRLSLSRDQNARNDVAEEIAKRNQVAENKAREKERAANMQDLAKVQKELNAALNASPAAQPTAVAPTPAQPNTSASANANSAATVVTSPVGSATNVATPPDQMTTGATLELPGIGGQPGVQLPGELLALNGNANAANGAGTDPNAATAPAAPAEQGFVAWLTDKLLWIVLGVVVVMAALMFFFRRRER